jgi:hypothetical protein
MRLRSAFEGILLQSERRWRSLATGHLEKKQEKEEIYIIIL